MEKTVAGQGPKRLALGRGMSSLLGDFADTSETKDDGKLTSPLKTNFKTPDDRPTLGFFIPTEEIEVNPRQPRKRFDETKLAELSESIKREGILQPLIVTPLGIHEPLKGKEGKTKFLLVAGERRLRAALKAGLEKVPVVVKDVSAATAQDYDREVLRFALIENIQRADLTVIEEAKALEALVKEGNLTQEQCAEQVGKDRSTIANTLRLLLLPQEIQQDLIEERLSMGHARALLPLEDKKLMLRARDVILKKQLNVRQTEQLIKTLRAQVAGESLDEKKAELGKADLDYLAQSLRAFFRTKVRLSGSGQRGRIEISYFSASELERLLVLMGQTL